MTLKTQLFSAQRSIRLLSIALFSFLYAACTYVPSLETLRDTSGDIGTVVAVIDGDTIDVLIGGQTFRVRYVGIDTPERSDPCYDAAAKRNAELVLFKTVNLVVDVSDTDRHGRLLRYVYVEDTFVNEVLVKEGYAIATAYAPDTAQHEHLDALEAEAIAANLNCHKLRAFAEKGVLSDGDVGFTCEGEACIKGNVNSKGEKIYHYPGCPQYEDTQITREEEKMFTNEAEAQAAGWRRAGNC